MRAWAMRIGALLVGSGCAAEVTCSAATDCADGNVVCYASTKDVCERTSDNGCLVSYTEVGCAEGDCLLDPECMETDSGS